jgi:hypothetical protein
MPTKTVEGVSLQTNALDPLVYIPTTLTGGGTPILTVTYTDQDGNTGQTATITLPSNAAVGTVCRLAAYLASGDSGVRAVTNMSLTASTGGVVKIIGYLPLQVGTEGTSVHRSSPQPIYDVQPIFPVDGGETIGFYRSGSNQVGDLVGVLVALGEE